MPRTVNNPASESRNTKSSYRSEYLGKSKEYTSGDRRNHARERSASPVSTNSKQNGSKNPQHLHHSSASRPPVDRPENGQGRAGPSSHRGRTDDRRPANKKEAQDTPGSRRPSPIPLEDEDEDEEDPDPEASAKLEDILEAIDADGTVYAKPKHKYIIARLQKFGRYAPRFISPFLDLASAFEIAMCPPDEILALAAELDEDITEEMIAEAKLAYDATLNALPCIRDIWPALKDNPDALGKILRKLDYYIRRARTEDVHKVKHLVPTLICSYVEFCSPDWPLVDKKEERGWNNITSGYFMCPQRLMEQYNRNPEKMCQQYQEGKKLKEKDYPSFMYEGALIVNKNYARGFCRGPMLLSVFRALFTGTRTSRSKAPGPLPGKAGVAKMNKMNLVTPRHIAYAAVMTRFALNSQPLWSAHDGKYDMREFFKAIVNFFARKEDWASETLDWWNEIVFGKKPKKSNEIEDDEDDEDMDTLMDSEEQCAQAGHRKADNGKKPERTRATTGSQNDDPSASTAGLNGDSDD